MCSGVPLCGFKNHPDKTVALNHSLRKLLPGQAWCSGFTYIAVIKPLEQKQPEGEKGLYQRKVPGYIHYWGDIEADAQSSQSHNTHSQEQRE